MSTTLQDIHQHYEEDINREESSPNMETPTPIRILITTATGMMFGIALEKGRVFEPQVIRDQMLFRRFGMLKMFLSATAIGMLCFSLLSVFPQTIKRMGAALKRYPERPPTKSVLGVVTGAALLGCGMTISGACPGTIFVQLGTKVNNAWITIIGGLSGALFYSLTQSNLPKMFFGETSPRFSYLDQYLNLPYTTIALPLSCAMAVAVFGLELYSPWHKEVNSSLLREGVMVAGAWPPFIAGMMIGALQIPTVLVNQDTLGSATSYVTVVSRIWPSSLFESKGENYLKHFRFGLNNWWQVLHVGGAVVGGYMSATASGSLGTVPGLSPFQAFVGGFLMLFGSRLAGGCTSGHGLSGMGLLALMSFAAVPPMFGSGIATAVFMKYVLGMDI